MSNLSRYGGALLALQLAGGCSTESSGEALSEQRGGNAAAALAEVVEEQRPRLVLAFGDSLYAGYGMAPSQSFPAALGRELAERGIEAEVVNAGVSGETTAGGWRRLAQTLDRLPRKADLVILGLGANDVLRGIPPAEMRANLEAMLVELKRRDIEVLLTGLTMPARFRHPFFERYEAIIPELARRHGAELEPSLLEGVSTRREYLLADRVHPNGRGTQLMAERVAPLAAEMLD